MVFIFSDEGEQEMMKQNENEMNFSVPLEIIKASEIEPKEVKWLWYPYIPFGKVTLLQGDPDLCQYLGHNFFRFLRIFFLKFYRT